MSPFWDINKTKTKKKTFFFRFFLKKWKVEKKIGEGRKEGEMDMPLPHFP